MPLPQTCPPPDPTAKALRTFTSQDRRPRFQLASLSVLFPSAPPPATSIVSPHISKQAAGANTRLLAYISINLLPLVPSATSIFQSGPPSSQIYSTHNAEELIKSNLSAKSLASAVPYLVPSKGCSVPASSPLFVPQFLLDQMKSVIN